MAVRNRRGARKPSIRKRSPSAATSRAFKKSLRPLVERMVAEAIEDRLDALDSIEALREPGETPNEEFWKKHGL